MTNDDAVTPAETAAPEQLDNETLAQYVKGAFTRIQEVLPYVAELRSRFENLSASGTILGYGRGEWGKFCKEHLNRAPRTVREALEALKKPDVPCPECGELLPSKTQLKRHQNREHNAQERHAQAAAKAEHHAEPREIQLIKPRVVDPASQSAPASTPTEPSTVQSPQREAVPQQAEQHSFDLRVPHDLNEAEMKFAAMVSESRPQMDVRRSQYTRPGYKGEQLYDVHAIGLTEDEVHEFLDKLAAKGVAV